MSKMKPPVTNGNQYQHFVSNTLALVVDNNGNGTECYLKSLCECSFA